MVCKIHGGEQREHFRSESSENTLQLERNYQPWRDESPRVSKVGNLADS